MGANGSCPDPAEAVKESASSMEFLACWGNISPSHLFVLQEQERARGAMPAGPSTHGHLHRSPVRVLEFLPVEHH